MQANKDCSLKLILKRTEHKDKKFKTRLKLSFQLVVKEKASLSTRCKFLSLHKKKIFVSIKILLTVYHINNELKIINNIIFFVLKILYM